MASIASLRDFSTTLGGATASVTFQLPELEVQSVFTTAVVPDGGSILIGGLSRLRDIERRAEVPWMAKVPLLGFFFKEEGYSDEKESLMIMIRAWITDVKAELANLERRTLALWHAHRSHLRLEEALALCPGRAGVTLGGEGVLCLPGKLVAACAQLSGGSHVKVVVGVPEPVHDHAVQQLVCPMRSPARARSA